MKIILFLITFNLFAFDIPWKDADNTKYKDITFEYTIPAMMGALRLVSRVFSNEFVHYVEENLHGLYQLHYLSKEITDLGSDQYCRNNLFSEDKTECADEILETLRETNDTSVVIDILANMMILKSLEVDKVFLKSKLKKMLKIAKSKLTQSRDRDIRRIERIVFLTVKTRFATKPNSPDRRMYENELEKLELEMQKRFKENFGRL